MKKWYFFLILLLFTIYAYANDRTDDIVPYHTDLSHSGMREFIDNLYNDALNHGYFSFRERIYRKEFDTKGREKIRYILLEFCNKKSGYQNMELEFVAVHNSCLVFNENQCGFMIDESKKQEIRKIFSLGLQIKKYCKKIGYEGLPNYINLPTRNELRIIIVTNKNFYLYRALAADTSENRKVCLFISRCLQMIYE